jgi:histidinol dehydrogenase
MNVVPAQLAGRLSPSRAHRSANTVAGPAPDDPRRVRPARVDEVYAMGGAQAVAAFAYGFEDRR